MHVLSLERRAAVVSHLTDCGSVRATSRQTGVHKTTILSLILKLGEGCRWLHNRTVRGLHVGRVEADEMHSYVHTREQNLKPGSLPEHGESWLYLAIASTSKLILSYHVGEARDEANCEVFIRDLRGRVATVPLLNTDGLTAYEGPVARWFGTRGGPGGGVDYAQLVKNFSGKRRAKDYDRYAPAKSGQPLTTKRPVYGSPDLESCSTSFVERTNLSVRNYLKRFARRGTGFSKSLRHHAAMVAIFVAWFNFCRVHDTRALHAGHGGGARLARLDGGRACRGGARRRALRPALTRGPQAPPRGAQGDREGDEHGSTPARRPGRQGTTEADDDLDGAQGGAAARGARQAPARYAGRR
jgi:IS1 family transposase